MTIASPDPLLLERSPNGPLPRRAEGRSPLSVYARGFDRADPRPRIALVIGGFGLSASLSADAIRRLPPAIDLAFSPYAARPEPLLEQARARGMELLLALPTEPANYPVNDPGDRALLTGNPPAENAARLNWSLARFAGYVGVIGAEGAMRGERFAAIDSLLGGLQDTLRGRGLLYVDPRPPANPATPANNPSRSAGRGVDLVLDDPPTRSEMERRLAELERLARERGSALAFASTPSPVLVDCVTEWAAGLEARGVVLAPVTAVAQPPQSAQLNSARLAGAE